MSSFICREARLRVQALMAAAIVLLLPAVVAACPSCFGSSSTRVINSYLLTAGLMSLLPFSLILGAVGLFLYLRRQARLLHESLPQPHEGA